MKDYEEKSADYDLAEELKGIWQAIVKSGIPEEVRRDAFCELLKVNLSGNQVLAPHRFYSATENSTVEAEESANGSDEDILARIERETGVTRDVIDKVFYLDDGVVRFTKHVTKYGATTAEQARTIAQIIAVVYSLGMNKQAVPLDTIREACELMHCYDVKNFVSNQMTKIDGFILKGEGKNRRLEARLTGIRTFPALMEKVITNG